MDEIGIRLFIPIISVSDVSLAINYALALFQSERPALLILPSASPLPLYSPNPNTK
jgi:hypothetical protein